MSNAQLSVKQFAMLSLNQAQPPWHLGQLLAARKTKSFSLKSSIENLSAATATIFVSVRSAAILPGYFHLADAGETQAQQNAFARSAWGWLWSHSPRFTAVPSYNASPLNSDLEALDNLLKNFGASITFLSPSTYYGEFGDIPIPPWVVVGFSGTFGNLAQIGTRKLAFDPNNWSTADWNTVRGVSTGAVAISAADGLNMATVVEWGDTDSAWDDWPPTTPAEMYLMTGLLDISASENVDPGEPLGALSIYFANNPAGIQPLQITFQQLIADHLQVLRDTTLNLALNSIFRMPDPYTRQGVAGALAGLTSYIAWCDYIATLDVTDMPSSVSIAWDNPLTISAFTVTPTDKTQTPITVPQFVVNSDGTSTGGVAGVGS